MGTWYQPRSWAPFVALTAAIVVLLDATPRLWGSAELRPPEYGLASFYGPGFHGQQTASGKVFDQTEMVAAHRTLPLGTVVRVTNLENGRVVVVRVIDRGPYGRNFRKGTIIDLSKGAAQRLKSVKDGLVRVRVDVVAAPDARRASRE